MDEQFHTGLDLEVGSRLDDEYSMTCVAVTVTWYISCMRWIRGGTNVRSVGGGKLWVVVWVCGSEFFGSDFVNGVYLRYCDGILLGW